MPSDVKRASHNACEGSPITSIAPVRCCRGVPLGLLLVVTAVLTVETTFLFFPFRFFLMEWPLGFVAFFLQIACNICATATERCLPWSSTHATLTMSCCCSNSFIGCGTLARLASYYHARKRFLSYRYASLRATRFCFGYNQTASTLSADHN